MREHGFNRISDFIGKSLDAFTTHADLVERQRVAKAGGEGNQDAKTWTGDIERETNNLAAN